MRFEATSVLLAFLIAFALIIFAASLFQPHYGLDEDEGFLHSTSSQTGRVTQPLDERSAPGQSSTVLDGEQVLRQDIDRIEERLEEKERVRVIIDLEDGEDRDNFVNRYGLESGSAKLIGETSSLAVHIGREQLDAFRDDEQLTGLQEDLILRPVLSQSVPIIGADNLSVSLGYNGSGVAVAVLDTGVSKGHSAFQDRVVEEACFSTHNPGANVYSLCPGSAESSTANNSGLDCDSGISGCGHGTHVAGIVAADHASGDGAAPGADIIAIQVFSEFTDSGDCSPSAAPCALTYLSDVTAALNHVYDLRVNYTIAAASMSLGGGYYTSSCEGSMGSLATAISNLKSVGIASVAASGNDGFDDGMGTPACIGDAISVGATTKADAVAGYSNHASFLDVLAPGSSIYAPVQGGGYGTKSGTSMATPHVSGTFAQLRQAYPGKSVDELLSALKVTGTNLSDAGIVKPRINVDDAFAELFGVSYDSFDGSTTDFSAEANLSEVCDPVLESSAHGAINFSGCVDASNADLDSYVSISGNTVSLNSSVLSSWNRSATITLYDTGLDDPVIVDDDSDAVCDDCSLISFSGGDIVFSVSHFSSYTVVDNVSLALVDDTDSVLRETGENILFSANYSYTNGTPVSDGSCSVTYETASGSSDASMAYNATSTVYEHTRSFSAGGTRLWNVTCTHPSNPDISGQDDYTVTEYGSLRAVFESHEYEQLYLVGPDQTFISGAAVYCDGSGFATCGTITAYHRDNRTGAFSQTDTNPATTPLFTTSAQPQTCALTSAEPCYFNWTINASGALNSTFSIQLNYSSDESSAASLTGTQKSVMISSSSVEELSQVSNVSRSVGASESHSISGSAVSSQGGNVTSISLLGNQSTLKWQGFYGDVQSGLSLGDGTDIFFNFSSADPFAVIATPSTSFDFSNVSAAEASDVDTFWNFLTASEVDQAVDTFTRRKFFGDIKDVPYTTLHETFFSGVIRSGVPASKSDIGFIATINSSRGFRNETLDYELLVPVESGTENYYLYLALN